MWLRLLGCRLSLFEDLRARRVIYTDTLDVQCWAGIEKPQVTFPFESKQNGRGTWQALVHSSYEIQPGSCCQFFELFSFLGMILHGFLLWALVPCFFLQVIFLFTIKYRLFTSECFLCLLSTHCRLGRGLQRPFLFLC